MGHAHRFRGGHDLGSALSQVITHLDSIWNILAYGGGFATSTLVGMWIEDKMALGSAIVHVISMANGGRDPG